MTESLIKLGVVLSLFWLVFVMPPRVLFPYIIANQLAYMSPRARQLMKMIPFYYLDRKADIIHRLLKKSDVIEYMQQEYPFTLKWYKRVHGLWFKVMVAIIVAGFFVQVEELYEFAQDPKAYLDNMRSAADQWIQLK